MRPSRESNVTVFERPVPIDQPGSAAGSAGAGVWTLAGERLSMGEPGGPATLLVPSEQVLLLAVDLPLPSRARRLEALPFAVEDRIADPLNAVHLALGTEVAPRRYLTGVVRHERMAEWIAAVELMGLGHAALVPDALALPVVGDDGWAVDLGPDRAVVRAADGTGFACPTTMLMPAWEAAGRPRAHGVGAPLPEAMQADAGGLAIESVDGIAARLAMPALDLRQGRYARRRAPMPAGWGRRLGWIAAIGAVAHAGIAAADTVMLKVIAERRAEDTRALAALAAPGTQLGDNLAVSVADLLPAPGVAAVGGGPFLPLVTQVSGALAPLSAGIAVRSMRWEAGALTMDFEPGDPGLAQRIGAAMRDARVAAEVTTGPDGSVRLVARGA